MGYYCTCLGGCPGEAYEDIGESWYDTCEECPYWKPWVGDDNG